MRPGIEPLGLGMVYEAENLHISIPNGRPALEGFVNWNSSNVNRIAAVRLRNGEPNGRYVVLFIRHKLKQVWQLPIRDSRSATAGVVLTEMCPLQWL
jgi:hypothetical protein